jgi:hypothetical protein
VARGHSFQFWSGSTTCLVLRLLATVAKDKHPEDLMPRRSHHAFDEQDGCGLGIEMNASYKLPAVPEGQRFKCTG